MAERRKGQCPCHVARYRTRQGDHDALVVLGIHHCSFKRPASSKRQRYNSRDDYVQLLPSMTGRDNQWRQEETKIGKKGARKN